MRYFYSVMVLVCLLCSQEIPAQKLDSIGKLQLKGVLLQSKEAQEWQNVLILLRKTQFEQRLQCITYDPIELCGKYPSTEQHREQIAAIFRNRRIIAELEDSVLVKSAALRDKFPEIVTEFTIDEIFPELYLPVRTAFLKFTRDSYKLQSIKK